MNQLVTLFVGCFLFFWGITYFMNTSLSGINALQDKQYVYTTQAVDKCTYYLLGTQDYFTTWTGQLPVKGDCFTTEITKSSGTIKTKLVARRQHVSKLLFE